MDEQFVHEDQMRNARTQGVGSMVSEQNRQNALELMRKISLCRNPLHSAAVKSDSLRCHIRPEIPARQEHRLHPTADD